MGFFSSLADQLNQKHPLYLLAGKINWPIFEEAFKKYYSEKTGAPAKPIRLMVSLLILKYVRNLSDENLRRWDTLQQPLFIFYSRLLNHVNIFKYCSGFGRKGK